MLNIGIVQNQAAASYIFDVKTDNVGTSNNDQFTLPLVSSGTYNFVIDWGDGSAKETITAWNQAETTHTFSGGAGTYTINIWGTIIGWYFASGGDKDKIIDISRWGTLQVGTTQGRYFQDCTNLTISSTDVLKTNLVTDMNLMFSGCTSLVDIPNIRFWDTSGVTAMTAVFSDSDLFNADLSEWDVGNVTNFTNFCLRARDFTSDLSSWDTSSMTTAVNMFNDANDFDSDCSAWDVTSLTNATNMFSGSNLSSDNYNLLLEGWSAQSLQSSVSFHGGNGKWYFGYGGQGRFDMIANYSWTITDGGQNDAQLGCWLNAHNLLKSSANPSDGTLVPTWSDLSDNAINATASGAQQPTFKTGIANGQPMVLFDGSDTKMDIAADPALDGLFATGGWFIAAVYPLSDGENNIGRIFSQGGGNTYVDIREQSGSSARMAIIKSFNTDNGAWKSTNLDINIGQVNIVAIAYNADSAANDPVFYINSKTAVSVTEAATPAGTTNTPSAIQLGNAVFANRSFDGYIGDIAFYKNKIPTTQEISDQFDYLADKYGVTLV